MRDPIHRYRARHAAPSMVRPYLIASERRQHAEQLKRAAWTARRQRQGLAALRSLARPVGTGALR
ncbi:hypothetical protein ACFQRF_00915 [Marinactinospora rubrisoli]|uniref:Uncharacterized protein n=1 Tax=Marinactinospora rubrisoli TaxID=2715399 RepID=A0ABW2KAJ1_9ACTN